MVLDYHNLPVKHGNIRYCVVFLAFKGEENLFY